jgi:TonB family protein
MADVEMRRSITRLIFAGAALFATPLGSRALPAQEAGLIIGSVIDSAGAGIAGAEIQLAGLGISTRTDETGKFRLSPPVGSVMLSVRRLGFSPVSSAAESRRDEHPSPVMIVMAPLPTTLRPVVVKTDRVKYSGRLAGYYERLERKNGGLFISRDEIDRLHSRSMTELLTKQPGVNSTRMRDGGSGVRLRGRQCWPLVWLDGIPMGAGEVDLDSFSPTSLQGIELYLGSTTAPMKYIAVRDQSSCGTILLWSRGPDTDPIRRSSPVDLQRLVSTLQVYTSDKVDRPATLDSPDGFTIDYPPAVYADGNGGSVTAEFVVGVDGKVEQGTFSIVASTNDLLSDAVRRAVEGSTFHPALLHGVIVRQVVQQPFSFPARDKKKS